MEQKMINKSIDELQRRVRAEYGDLVYEILLYGSCARGDYDDGSDVDVLVIMNCSVEELRDYTDKILDISDDISLCNDINISVQTSDYADWQKYKDISMYYRNVQREGILVA